MQPRMIFRSISRLVSAPDRLRHRSQAELAAGLHRSFSLNFGDVQWKMVVVPEPAGLVSTGHERSSIVLIFGLLLSGGLTSFIWAMRRNARKVEMANDRFETGRICSSTRR